MVPEQRTVAGLSWRNREAWKRVELTVLQDAARCKDPLVKVATKRMFLEVFCKCNPLVFILFLIVTFNLHKFIAILQTETFRRVVV